MRRPKVPMRWMLAALIVWRAAAGGTADGEGGKAARIRIQTYDFAKINEKALTRVEGIASEIFASAGLNAEWETGPVAEGRQLGNDFSGSSGNICAVPLASAQVRVQFLARAPSGFSPQALGYALPCAHFGIQVSIYLDRVAAVSASTNATYERVLGYAIAHEVGHVLLRSSSHASSGVMKAVWSKIDWQRASFMKVEFSAEERELVLVELRKLPTD
jgi:hypothetical protein